MAINGVEIKVGQVWRSRGGDEWEITGPYPHGAGWDWLATRISGPGSGSESSFSDDGLFWPKVSLCNTGPHDNDLMFLVSDPDVKPERRKQQEPNSPLRRQDDMIPVPETVPDLAASPADFAASVPGMLDDRSETTKAHMPATVSALLDHPEIAPFSKQRAESVAEAGRAALRELVEGAAGYVNPRKSALDVQIGGGHYKQFAIQPVEFIHKNGIPFIEGNCIKYLARWRDKGGIEDLKKVKHYIDLLIEMESKK